MTIRTWQFWAYALSVAVIGACVILALFVTLYHPAFEARSSFIVLDTDAGSISLQWYRGVVSLWLSGQGLDWRVLPP